MNDDTAGTDQRHPSDAPAARRDKPVAEWVHLVSCPYCYEDFDLFHAAWCAHEGTEPSKVCPRCRKCVCEHPAYAEPHFWSEAPPLFQRHGFRSLFLFYL